MNHIKGIVGDTLQINAYVSISNNLTPDKVVFACKELKIKQELTCVINENNEVMYTHTFSPSETKNWDSGIYKVTFSIYIEGAIKSKFYDFALLPNNNLME